MFDSIFNYHYLELFKIFILKLTDMSVIMKRNKTFLKEKKKTGEIQIILEAEFAVGITVKLKKHFPLLSESNHNLYNAMPEFSLKSIDQSI